MSPLLRQVLRFLVSGVAASGTHYALYVVWVHLGWLAPVPATVLGFCVGTLVSYALNARFTFQGETTARTFARFWVVTLLGGALNTLLVALLTRAGLHFAVAGVLAIGAAAAFNFTGHRLWTFAADQPPSSRR